MSQKDIDAKELTQCVENSFSLANTLALINNEIISLSLAKELNEREAHEVKEVMDMITITDIVVKEMIHHYRGKALKQKPLIYIEDELLNLASKAEKLLDSSAYYVSYRYKLGLLSSPITDFINKK